MNEYHPSITNILYNNYISYDTLFAMTKFAFAGSNAESVDVYIDMNSLLRKLYAIQDISIEDYSSITSSIINLCAHMRSYFWTRHRTYSRFFIVYSRNNPFKGSVYNSMNLAQDATNRITSVIEQNIELLSSLCPYLGDIFFFDGGDNETAVVIHHLIQNCPSPDRSGEHPVIILTKDTIDYQLVAFNSRTFIYRPHKAYDKDNKIMIDDSWAVTKSCFYKAYKYDSFRKMKSDALDTLALSPQLIGIIMAISGLKSRSIRSIIDIPRTVNLIKEASANSNIVNGYNSDIGFLLRKNNLCKGLSEEHILEIINNYSQIDLINNYTIFSLASIASKTLLNSYINKNDPDEVRHINNVYFEHNPLDLNRL